MDGSHHRIAIVLAGSLVVAAAVALTGCSGGGSGTGDASQPSVNDQGYQVHAMHMADPETTAPPFASGTPELAAMYTFAYEHPEILSYIPCTCGCGAMGHLSNWNCYVKGIDADGGVTFEAHATGCQVCQEITTDVMRLWQRGSPLFEIRDYIDASYPGEQTPTEYPSGM
ncbi:MAG TPA: PCYCGC motif-containing (lipo)protein [Actinomycetota bacterium]|nr:PCYCGC motif-containing (lipo)protein [Actinomycetota bacterium]